MKQLIVILLAGALGYCSAGAPAFAQDALCHIPRVHYPPHVYLPEDNATPPFAPDNRKIASWEL